MLKYNRANWYWIVGGDEAQVYSSAAAAYKGIEDVDYVAWTVAGGIATRISANDMLRMRIDILEQSITERMKQEALAGSISTFASGAHAGKTSAQVIAEIVESKDTLRAQIS